MLKLIRSAIVVSFLFLVFPLAAFSAQVDINSADAATLAEGVNGIGPSKAQAIVDYRTKNGRFVSVDDLVNVKGIGIKTVDRIREYLIVAPVSGVTESAPAVALPTETTFTVPAAPAN